MSSVPGLPMGLESAASDIPDVQIEKVAESLENGITTKSSINVKPAWWHDF